MSNFYVSVGCCIIVQIGSYFLSRCGIKGKEYLLILLEEKQKWVEKRFTSFFPPFSIFVSRSILGDFRSPSNLVRF
ncbi:hypothetical protein RJT34_20586 [Clitoria ternatea]|uniref:Uncharacterized protein n=1 Tax=Clitoria ternatea TaxID=43366 RepID=A0AAN9IT20_CLITE